MNFNPWRMKKKNKNSLCLNLLLLVDQYRGGRLEGPVGVRAHLIDSITTGEGNDKPHNAF